MKKNLKYSIDQKGMVSGLVVLLIFVGIVIGITLIKNPTFFSPKASESSSVHVSGDSPYTPTIPSNMANRLYEGLMAYWSFDEPAGNVTADLKGMYNGTATGTTIVEGKVGKARNFNGTKNDYLSVGNKFVASVNSVTFSAWVQTPMNTGTRQSIINSEKLYTQGDWRISAPGGWHGGISDDNRFGITIGKGTSEASKGWYYCYSKTVLQPNTWYHVAVSNDHGTRKLYLNGVFERSCGNDIGNDLPNLTDASTVIGQDLDINNTNTIYSEYFYRGIIDELGVWGRVLSDEEIKALAEGKTPAAYSIGTLKASPNPCKLDPKTKLCTVKISWDYTGKASNVQVKIKETGGLFANAVKASADAPWISAAGVTFEVYSGNTLIDALFVNGTTEGASVPTIPTTSTPNTCFVGSDGKCSVKVVWDYGNTKDVKITIKEVPGSLFAAGPKNEQIAPWITEKGATFEAYSGTTLLGSVFVKGIKASGTQSGGTMPIVIIPGPVAPAPVATTPPATTPTAVPVVWPDNPAYHYHYDPNSN